jgi:hypothetical protein
VPPNTRAQETFSDFSDSLFTEFSEVGQKQCATRSKIHRGFIATC